MPDTANDGAIAYRVTEPRTTPALSLLLGFGAMLPLVPGAACAWALGGTARRDAITLAVLWAAAVLCFLGGVRRGVSFRTPGGPTVAQIATMLWLFSLGMAAIWVFVLGVTARGGGSAVAALALLLLGYASIAALDPLAARRGEAPIFFARLRPVQMLISLASLVALLVRCAIS